MRLAALALAAPPAAAAIRGTIAVPLSASAAYSGGAVLRHPAFSQPRRVRALAVEVHAWDKRSKKARRPKSDGDESGSGSDTVRCTSHVPLPLLLGLPLPASNLR